jgi:hypothetical protein
MLRRVVGMGAVLAAAQPAAAAGVDVEFVGEVGVQRRGPLAQLWHVGFESVRPVRAFPSYRGQRSFSGRWWSATTGRHVGFESWLERDHLMLLDRDPVVVGIASQPFGLSWVEEGGRRRRHVPDYFARLADGSGLVVDVRPDEQIEARDAAAFAATAQACAAVGWQYRRVGGLDAVVVANLRWLAGYRHRRCRDTVVADALVGEFGEPRPLAEGAAAAGDRLCVLSTLFHLLWAGVLHAELGSAPLSGSTVVTAAAGWMS